MTRAHVVWCPLCGSMYWSDTVHRCLVPPTFDVWAFFRLLLVFGSMSR